MVDFIGIGAQKSATSWLFQCLREHTGVCLAEEKELHYFSDNALYAKGHEWYEAHWRSCSAGQRKGEISTSYLTSPTTPARIKAYAPQAKLIALLRHPVDRAESHLRHLVSRGELPKLVRLEEALSLRPDVFENGLYGAALARYEALFPREQLFVVSYNEVQKDPQALLDRIFAFLELPRIVPSALRARYNAASFRSTKAHDQIHTIYFTLKKSAAGRALLRTARSFGVTAARVANVGAAAGKGKEGELFTLTQGERQELARRYEADRALLGHWGISFS